MLQALTLIVSTRAQGMWHVSFADERLDKYDGHLSRRRASLPHVSHGEFMAARLRAGRGSR